LKNCGGAKSLDQLFGVNELWTSPLHFRSSAYNEIVTTFEINRWGERPREPFSQNVSAREDARPTEVSNALSRHKILNCSDEIGNWKTLWPTTTNNFPRADDNALVLLGNFHGTKILLLSNLGRAGQSALLSTTNNLRADILVAGLSNEGEPLSDALLDAIQPKVIVIADSEFPAMRRANSRLQERLEQRKIPVIYTRDSGAVTILADKNIWQLETMGGQKFNSVSFSK